MPAIKLQHEIQFDFLKNPIKEVRTKNKRPDNQTILKHATIQQQRIWIIAELVT